MTLGIFPGGFCPKPLGCLATAEQKWRENENLTNFSFSSAAQYFLSRCVFEAESWVSRPHFHPLSNGTFRFLKNCTTFTLYWSQHENVVFFNFHFCGFYCFAQIQLRRLKQILMLLVEEIQGYLSVYLVFCKTWLWLL